MLMNSSGINYVINENEHFHQYDPHIISERMPFYYYPASLVNQNEIPIELLY